MILLLIFYPCAMISCLVFRCLIFNNTCLTGCGVAGEEGAVELESIGSYGIGFEEGEEVGLVAVVQAVVIMITRIIFGVCEYLFAPLFGAYLQTFIRLIGGIFGQLFVGVLSIFNGLFGELIGYVIAPQIGGDLTNFIGCINGLSRPRGGIPIVSRFLVCFNGYCNGFVIDRVAVLTAITVAVIIVEGIGFEYGLWGSRFKSPNGVFLATNNSDIERLFGAPFGAFNTTNSGDINGGIKEEFENVVAPYISVYSATIENQLGGAFLSSIIGLNMIKLFQAPAMNIANFNYHFDFKREREIEMKGFQYGVLKFFDKDKEKERKEGYIDNGFEYGTTVPLITTNDIDNCFERKREREGKYKFGTGVPITTTHNIILEFLEKKEKDLYLVKV